MSKAKISLLAALFAGLVAVMLINEIGISRYPPAGRFADGMIRGFYPSDVRSRMGGFNAGLLVKWMRCADCQGLHAAATNHLRNGIERCDAIATRETLSSGELCITDGDKL